MDEFVISMTVWSSTKYSLAIGSRDNSGHRPLKSFSDSQRDFQPTSSQMEPKQVAKAQDEHQPRYNNYDSRNVSVYFY